MGGGGGGFNPLYVPLTKCRVLLLQKKSLKSVKLLWVPICIIYLSTIPFIVNLSIIYSNFYSYLHVHCTEYNCTVYIYYEYM